MPEITKVSPIAEKAYGKEDLIKMNPTVLGALLRKRTHHNIEVDIYPTLLRWKGNPKPNFLLQARMVFDVWKERRLPQDTPNIEWVKENLAIAKKIRAGKRLS